MKTQHFKFLDVRLWFVHLTNNHSTTWSWVTWAVHPGDFRLPWPFNHVSLDYLGCSSRWFWVTWAVQPRDHEWPGLFIQVVLGYLGRSSTWSWVTWAIYPGDCGYPGPFIQVILCYQATVHPDDPGWPCPFIQVILGDLVHSSRWSCVTRQRFIQVILGDLVHSSRWSCVTRQRFIQVILGDLAPFDFLLPLIMEENLWRPVEQIFTGRIQNYFAATSQQYQMTEWNTEHWSQMWTINGWPLSFFISLVCLLTEELLLLFSHWSHEPATTSSATV